MFLDRDGTLNVAVVRDGLPYPPASVEEFRLVPGAAEACRRMAAAGFLRIVATNQPDVGRGVTALSTMEAIHAHLQSLIALDGIEVCTHPGRGFECACRKPRPGMLLRAAARMGIDLTQSWMIGDRWRDVDCGHAAGCRTIFIDGGYEEELRTQPDFVVPDISCAADIVLAGT